MTDTTAAPTGLRNLTASDIKQSLASGLRDFRAAPLLSLFFASFFVVAGAVMAVITYWTGQTFWLVLAVLGFPMIGSLASVGFYEMSRQISAGRHPTLRDVSRFVWSCRTGQVPWLATIVVVIFLFWFFLGHMIFALFLGLTPMTNISTSGAVFATPEGIMMLAMGTLIGALFSTLVFAITVHGLPLLVDKDIDFITAMIRSVSAVSQNLAAYAAWALLIVVLLFVAILPLFLGLFIALPVLGHATWHLYARLST